MSRPTRTIGTAIAAAIIISTFVTGALLAKSGARRKPDVSFTSGPQSTAQGLFIVTLQGTANLKPRKMQTLQFSVVDAAGQAVSNAAITVDGGMPEHGHGLPTKPRVTSELGNGWYEINGLRFNMGGWWELKLTITTPAGTDTVTFNLAI